MLGDTTRPPRNLLEASSRRVARHLETSLQTQRAQVAASSASVCAAFTEAYTTALRKGDTKWASNPAVSALFDPDAKLVTHDQQSFVGLTPILRRLNQGRPSLFSRSFIFRPSSLRGREAAEDGGSTWKSDFRERRDRVCDSHITERNGQRRLDSDLHSALGTASIHVRRCVHRPRRQDQKTPTLTCLVTDPRVIETVSRPNDAPLLTRRIHLMLLIHVHQVTRSSFPYVSWPIQRSLCLLLHLFGDRQSRHTSLDFRRTG